MQSPFRNLVPLFILFSIVEIFVFTSSGLLSKYNIDATVLNCANFIFFFISVISFFIQRKGMMNKNPHVFVRSVTGGMMIKMLFCVIAVVAYVYLAGSQFNKKAIFISLFLYLFYLAAEVLIVMKMNRKHNA